MWERIFLGYLQVFFEVILKNLKFAKKNFFLVRIFSKTFEKKRKLYILLKTYFRNEIKDDNEHEYSNSNP